ncbi:branched-chain amino acid ABC transporter permease [Bosea caraganae]|uniref:Branched-chain amino acid ABC transporter permease n=1 Tax=Bosea caraganae TaxID=2763117 RepID=A0A370LDI6_9HYPH|nr:AzlC family ABC transporter permease [Bosea caraganae]RDJ27591.1 branched-chain amino acid ABC transporter permease [Bosea caraganae]RDJ29605.1 branched-chain amino acid ABC transporter permease [Bosea caraganae]
MSVSPDWGWRRVMLAGMRDALALPAWIVCLSLVGVGSLARDVGYPVGVAVLSTVLVWAGPSQVLFFGSIAAGAAWSAIAFAIGFASLRFLPMTVTLLPLLRRPGQGFFAQALMAHYMAVTVWTESLRRLPAILPHQRVSYYLGFANACILTSSLGTFAGYYLVSALPAPLAAGLLCLTPIFFLSSLVAGIRHGSDAAAVALGFCLAPLCERFIGGGFDLIISGVLGGSLAFGVRHLAARRA